MKKKFLTATWENLILINYKVEPEILLPYLPYGVELDYFKGQCIASIVAFQFLDTKILGLKIPHHINFGEVNLRFYVKERVNDEWKRGVVFIREFVSKPMITLVANVIYNENYKTSRINYKKENLENTVRLTYSLKHKSIQVEASKLSNKLEENSIEEFITEHYWGYTKISENKTYKYQVEHPRWEISKIEKMDVHIDFAKLYGLSFSYLNHSQIHSAFVARGSEISVYKKDVLKSVQ